MLHYCHLESVPYKGGGLSQKMLYHGDIKLFVLIIIINIQFLFSCAEGYTGLRCQEKVLSTVSKIDIILIIVCAFIGLFGTISMIGVIFLCVKNTNLHNGYEMLKDNISHSDGRNSFPSSFYNNYLPR